MTDHNSRPNVSVGIRFHNIDRLPILLRCLNSVAAQEGVTVNLILALQDLPQEAETKVREATKRAFWASDSKFDLINLANPDGRDLRSRMLNAIVDTHYEARHSDYLCFIDYDDIWFQKALVTLIEPLQLGEYAVSYADIHCAHVFYDAGQIYLRDIRDVFRIHQKTKRNLLQDNFLPIHSYMFQTARIDRELLRYDDELVRLEDYDVLMRVAARHAFTGMHRRRLIGLYNFYSSRGEAMNTSQNVFEAGEKPDEQWEEARRALITRHSNSHWLEFAGEGWLMP